MSLTTFINEDEIKNRLLEVLTIPETPPGKIIIPRRVAPYRAALLGTALDYAIRFWLERQRESVFHPNKLIAERGMQLDIFSTQEQMRRYSETYHTAIKEIRNAKSVNNDFLYHCFQLANLDKTFRTGEYPKTIPTVVHKNEIDELKALLKLAIERWPVIEEVCILNPSFGTASILVNGADADIYQDETLIDIKCVVKKSFPSVIMQLIGYAILAKLDVIDGLPASQSNPKWIGVYYARHGEYSAWAIDELVKPDDFDALMDFFIDYAAKI